MFPFCACGQRIVSGAEALPGAFDAAVARQQVVAVNAVAVAMEARNLRRVTDRALALIEARLAALMPANPPGRPPQLAGSRVDDWRGGGRRWGLPFPAAFAVPVPHSPPWLRFQSPLIEPDVRISRIRLSDEIMPSPTEDSEYAR